MKDSGRTTAKKILAVIISVLMASVLLFSVFYIAAEADHECEGAHCQVCECIEICAGLLQRFGFGSGHTLVAAAAVFALISVIFCYEEVRSENTPVTLKVRLNN